MEINKVQNIQYCDVQLPLNSADSVDVTIFDGKNNNASENNSSVQQDSEVIYYLVTGDDTLEIVANDYDLPVEDLIAYNKNLKDITADTVLSDTDIKTVKIITTEKAIVEELGFSPEFLEDLISMEGKSKRLYKDAVGVTTIGVGHNVQILNDKARYNNVKLNDKQIYSLLARDLVNTQNVLRKVLVDDSGNDVFAALTKSQQEALCDLAFNLDIEKSPKLINALKNNDLLTAIKEMDQIYGNQKVLPGLVKRRFMDISYFIKDMNLENLPDNEKEDLKSFFQNIYDEGLKNSNIFHRIKYNMDTKKYLGDWINTRFW